MRISHHKNGIVFFLLKAVGKCSVAFFLLAAFFSSSHGQTYFYIQSKLQTTDKKPLAYDIFLRIEFNGTASARISFKDPVTGKNRLIKQNYIDNDFPDRSYNDKTIYLMPFGFAYNEKDNPEKNFVTPRFQFDKGSDMNLATALKKVFYSYDNQQWFLPVSGSFINMPSLSGQVALVKRFYKQNELFYKYALDAYTPILTAEENRRQFFLITIDATNDPQIGPTTLIDQQNLETNLVNYFLALRVGFNFKKIDGQNFTKKVVNDAIDNLKPGPKDIVMLLYSGHGFRYNDDVSDFPRMALVASAEKSPDDANLALEEVYNRILKKGAMVTIVLADCCNEKYGAAPPVGVPQPPIEASPGPPPPLNSDSFRALFIPKHRISVLACASEKNQLAAGNEVLGGFYSHFLVSELFKSLWGNTGEGEISWNMILDNVKEYTRRQALTAPCGKDAPCDGDRSLQRPQFKVSANNIQLH
jgi:hypothetical protein